MTLSAEAHIRARLMGSADLVALIGDRLEPSASSELSDLPRVVYSLYAADHQEHHGGAAGLVFLGLQFDVFAASQATMVAVCEAIRNRLDGFRGTITTDGESRFFGRIHLDGERDESIPPSDGSDQIIYRRLLDFAISTRESIPTLT